MRASAWVVSPSDVSNVRGVKRVHRAAALRVALSPDVPGGRPRCPLGHTRWAQLRVVCGPRSYLPDGSLSLERLRHFADHVAATAGTAKGQRVRQWFQDKKAGWYTVLADPRMPVTSTLLDQAHNAIDRKLFMMKGFHHPKGSQQAFLRGLAHLYNLVPYQLRAQHAGQCGVEAEGGTVPTRDWFLNLQILTSGGFR
jgi:hypothetical protein